jgi:hypothetical protein
MEEEVEQIGVWWDGRVMRRSGTRSHIEVIRLRQYLVLALQR